MSELSREEIKTQLRKLAKHPPPSNLLAGAMCYKKADPPNRTEYICPKCSGKTLYAIFAWLLAFVTRFCCKRKAVINDSDFKEKCQAKIDKRGHYIINKIDSKAISVAGETRVMLWKVPIKPEKGWQI